MKRLDGNNLLMIHPDKVFFETFIQEAEEIGATVTGARTLEEAKQKLQSLDFDLIFCYHSLEDGSGIDLLEWIQQERLELKVISVGFPLGKEKIYRDAFRELVDEGKHLSTYLETVHAQLFAPTGESFCEFIDSDAIESSIYFEKKKYLVQTIELHETSIALASEEVLPLGTPVTLRLSIFDQGNFQNFIFLCTYREEQDSVKLFEISPAHLPSWNKLRAKLQSKQESMSSFLKKASGD